jgi:MinD superfamily P-loop ATPase
MIHAAHGAAKPLFTIDPIACEGCGVCAYFCAQNAIEFSPVVNGELFVSETRCGPMVHARLGVAEENSGKLVSRVRQEAKRLAELQDLNMVLIDGSPGIGCPVIASLTGADLALVVTEPTLSGMHDLERVLDLTGHFGVQAAVCINKWDLNKDLTQEIEARARQRDVPVAGRVRYDRQVTAAQIHGQAVVECECGVADDIRNLWKKTQDIGEEHGVRV